MDNTLTHGVAGYFKAHAYRPSDGRVRELCPWTKNLITDNGMYKLTNGTVAGTSGGSFFGAIRVGSGSTAPSFTDTALVAHVASVNAGTTPTSVGADTASSTPYVSSTVVFTFATGVAAGNLTELGLAGSASTAAGYPLWTRALFRDGGGTPITVVVAADEQLVITYELRIYVPTTASTAVLLNSANSTNYTVSILPRNIGASVDVASILTNGLGLTCNFIYYGAASGTLGTIGATPPSGTSSSQTFTSSYNYTPGNFYRDITVTAALTSSNFADIGGFAGNNSIPINWQWVISPKITKTSSQTLAFTFRLALARV